MKARPCNQGLLKAVDHQLNVFKCLKTFSGCKSFTHLNLTLFATLLLLFLYFLYLMLFFDPFNSCP